MALPPRVSPTDLATALASPSPPTLLDASWFMPGGRDGRAEFVAGPRIPGSLFFDVDAVTDKSSDLPHMLPPAATFAAVADALGVAGPDDGVVVYDRAGIFSAPRVWWTWRVFGHASVAVLDGGLPAWTAAGLPLETGAPRDGAADVVAAAAAAAPAAPPRYPATIQPALVRSLAQMMDNVASGAEAVCDARPAARFGGTTPEPRAGLASGHIPGSASVPFATLLTEAGTLKPDDEVRATLEAAGWRAGAAGNVATCGSGVTACILAWAAQACGLVGADAPVAVYDGSWSEWGGLADTPKAAG